MARARDTLPSVNAIRSFQGSNAEQLEAVRSSLEGGLGNVSRSIMNLSDTMMSMMSRQHKGLMENFDASQSYYNQSLQEQRRDKTSVTDWLTTLFQFQTSGNTKLHQQLIGSLERSERTQAEMFAPMGHALLSINQKLKDIRGNLLQLLRFTLLKARSEAAGGSRYAGPAQAISDDKYQESYLQDLNQIGAVNRQEWVNLIDYMRESMSKTLIDQIKGTPDLPKSRVLIDTFNAMLRGVDDNTKAVETNTVVQQQDSRDEKKKISLWSSISESLTRLDKTIHESLVKQLKEVGKALGSVGASGLGMGLGAALGGLLGGDLGMLLGGAVGASPFGVAMATMTAKSLWKVGSWLVRVHPVLGALALAVAGLMWWKENRDDEMAKSFKEYKEQGPEQQAADVAANTDPGTVLGDWSIKNFFKRNDMIVQEIAKQLQNQDKSLSDEDALAKAGQILRMGALNSPERIQIVKEATAAVDRTIDTAKAEHIKSRMANVDQLYPDMSEQQRRDLRIRMQNELDEIMERVQKATPSSVSFANPPAGPQVASMSANQANQPTVVPVVMPGGGGNNSQVAMVDQSTKLHAPIDPSKSSPRSDPFNSYYGMATA